ncbi:sterol homeostasis protein [Borealophlyctis nickersoniae]|nr:sterol homeostasis protein [Borealophlyctis nickersoniae]
MPVCVECGTTLSTLYTEYGKGNFRLSTCPSCNNKESFADKYLENDLVIIFIDMVLHKPQVYRHLLFNRIQYTPSGWNWSVIKLGILLVLFDYFYILLLCLAEFIIWHLTLRWVIWAFTRVPLSPEAYNRASMALTLSSFGKLLLLTMVIWDLEDYGWMIDVFVFTSNAEALSGKNTFRQTLPVRRQIDCVPSLLSFSQLGLRTHNLALGNRPGREIGDGSYFGVVE